MGSYWSQNQCGPFVAYRDFIQGKDPAECGFETTPTSLKNVRTMLVDWIAENRKGIEGDTLPEMETVVDAQMTALVVAWQCHLLQTRIIDIIDQREAEVLEDHPNGLSEEELDAAIRASIKADMGPEITVDEVIKTIAPTVEKFKIPGNIVSYFINYG